MIADWIYNFLVSLGYGFNKGIGIKDISEVSNIKTAIMMLLIIITFLIITIILLFIELLDKRGVRMNYYKPITPIKIDYICVNCGRKRTITYDAKNEKGGLLSTQFELCMPFMYCPRCNKLTMKEVKKNEEI